MRSRNVVVEQRALGVGKKTIACIRIAIPGIDDVPNKNEYYTVEWDLMYR